MDKLSWVSTVVGSFPKKNTPENMKAIFLNQINSGIDYPCYPQLISMIDQFLDPLCEIDSGLVKKDGKYYLESELKIPNEPLALEYGHFVQNFFKNNPDMKNKVKGWKACLTGPFTLAGEIITTPEMIGGKRPIVYKEPRVIMNPEIVKKLADFMASIAAEYTKMGADIISMDEPTLSLMIGRRKIFFFKADEIIEILNKAIAPIKKSSSIHICGNISPNLRDILLNSNVNIMDHEFANDSNNGIFEKKMFEREDKSLAYGVLISNVQPIEGGKVEDYVETPQIIENRIKKAVQTIGISNLIIKPDCGFAGLKATFGEELGTEIVNRKLEIMTETMKKFE
ncbi:MAG: hypothetical protein GY870_03040 [archaeon]|nr:hypothetical protein [archaeon]